MFKHIWLMIAWGLVLLVIYLSLTPHPPEPVSFDNADKFEHALAYAALSFWFCHIYRSVNSRLVVIAALVGLGVGLELVQGWTGYRTFDVMDMLADGVGVLMGCLMLFTPLMRVVAAIECRFARKIVK
jgi:VanZ family protein